MNFPIPLNNLIGPGLSLLLFIGALNIAAVFVIYRAYLQRQERAWAKPGRE